MAETKHRHGHPYRKKADIPARQRVKGRLFWAILFAVFGLLIAYFAAADRYLLLVIMAALGGVIGYFAGTNMEKDAVRK